MSEATPLTEEQRRKIKDVIYTLEYGLADGWVSPTHSLQACIGVLREAKESR